METFFGRGDLLSVLTEKMDKYSGVVGKVNFVIRSINSVLNFEELIEFWELQKEKERQVAIQIPNLQKQELESITSPEFIKKMKRIGIVGETDGKKE